MTGSVLIHVQHLLGIGHFQRARRIAEALARRGIAVTLVSGGAPIPGMPPKGGLRFVQLPPIRALDAGFALVDSAGAPVDEALRTRRRALLLDAFALGRPNVVVIEGFPFARRAFRFELDPLVAAARQAGSRLLCSVRDVIQPRDDPARLGEMVARIRADFDAVMVHGDPTLIPFEASFPAAPEIGDRLRYTGYVADEPGHTDPADTTDGGEVLVSAGGGPAGYALLQSAIAARRLGCLAEAPWRLLAGAGLPEAEFAALADSALPGVTVERFRPDFPTLLGRCRISVSQAGYNTVLDVLAARRPAVLVPYAAGGEREQPIRAERIAALGAAELLRESDLSPEELAAAIKRAAAHPPAALNIDRSGAVNSGRLIGAMVDANTTAGRGSAAARADGMIAR